MLSSSKWYWYVSYIVSTRRSKSRIMRKPAECPTCS